MYFNSLPYLFFFAAVYLIYWHIPNRARPALLLVASLFFYGWWHQLFLVHFVVIVLINYVLFEIMRRPTRAADSAPTGAHPRRPTDRRTLAFYAMLALNLGNLAFFKYTGALVQVVGRFAGEYLAQLFGANVSTALFPDGYENFTLILPLAISFYSFLLIALGVDAYRGEITEKISLHDYLLFSFFFPHLIAGPIMRHTDFFYQIQNVRFEEERMSKGILLILFGLVKKGILADNIAAVIDPVFANPSVHTPLTNLMAAIGFSFQLYLDFSGYTDMARGSAKLLGYEMPENFRGPYFSASFSEHWQRWHITLSTWLRDYLYIPMGGSRGSRFKTLRNLFLTMALGGLWHGHYWTYLAWGMIEGFWLVLERTLGLDRVEYRRVWARVLAVLVVFTGSVIARVFFRADSLTGAVQIFTSMFGEGVLVPSKFEGIYRFIGLGLIVHAMQYWKARITPWVLRYRWWLMPALSVAALFMFARLQFPGVSFIYFQF